MHGEASAAGLEAEVAIDVGDGRLEPQWHRGGEIDGVREPCGKGGRQGGVV